MIPGGGGTQRLPRWSGRPGPRADPHGPCPDADEAERIGLVTRVVPAGERRAAADDRRGDRARGPLAVREAKRLIDAASDLDLDAGLAAELDASVRIFATEDMLEGARAFFAKREPTYRGR